MEGRLTNRGAGQQQLTDVRADKLRHLLTELGPAFVKIGQAVSSRWGCCGCGEAGEREGALHDQASVPVSCCRMRPAVSAVALLMLTSCTAGCPSPAHRARPDVAPPEYLRELEKLQDQIPPFCNDQVRLTLGRQQAGYGVWLRGL